MRGKPEPASSALLLQLTRRQRRVRLRSQPPLQPPRAAADAEVVAGRRGAGLPLLSWQRHAHGLTSLCEPSKLYLSLREPGLFLHSPVRLVPGGQSARREQARTGGVVGVWRCGLSDVHLRVNIPPTAGGQRSDRATAALLTLSQ
jgi:hypothetical protein